MHLKTQLQSLGLAILFVLMPQLVMGAHLYAFFNQNFLHKPDSNFLANTPARRVANQLPERIMPEPTISWYQGALEVGKIIIMATAAAVTYGIVHDLITTQINFDYFTSDLTHHGPYTKKHFPWVYNSHNKVAYALLWGTIATWWVGLPLGARCQIGRE